jgi:hypothetical protein
MEAVEFEDAPDGVSADWLGRCTDGTCAKVEVEVKQTTIAKMRAVRFRYGIGNGSVMMLRRAALLT